MFGAERDGNSGLLIDIRAAENQANACYSDKFTLTPVGYMIQDNMVAGMVIDHPGGRGSCEILHRLPRLFKLALEIRGGGAISKNCSHVAKQKDNTSIPDFCSKSKRAESGTNYRPTAERICPAKKPTNPKASPEK